MRSLLARYSIFCNLILQRFSLMTINFRYSSSALTFFKKKVQKVKARSKDSCDDKELPDVISSGRFTYSLKHFKKIEDYFNSKPCLKNIKEKIPPHFMFRRYQKPGCIYIVDSDVAGEIFSVLKPFLKSSKSRHILEVNAGVGVFTEYLLKAKLPRLRIYESESSPYEDLKALIKKYKSGAKVLPFNLLKLYYLIMRDRNDNGNRFGACFKGMSSLSWEDEPVMKVILTIDGEGFIKQILYGVLLQSGFCAFGRPEFFVIMPPVVYIKYTVEPQRKMNVYRARNVLFEAFFECELLKKVPSKAFLPWMARSETKSRVYVPDKEDEDKFYLVRITARRDLLEKISADNLKPFWYFVKQMMQKRRAKVIAVLEKWIPGCGIRLIPRGYTIFTMAGSLTAEQYVELFQEFISWPEFKTSSFLSNMESFMVTLLDPGEYEETVVDQAEKKRVEESESDGEGDDSDDSEDVHGEYDELDQEEDDDKNFEVAEKDSRQNSQRLDSDKDR